MALRAVPDHPKFAVLMAKLHRPKYVALGCLEAIWHFTGRFTPQGNIGKYSDKSIEAWVQWDGAPGALITALVEAGWLDTDEIFRLIVHDWDQHADKATKQCVRRLKLNFCVPTVHTPGTHKEPKQQSVRPPGALPVPVPVPEPEAKTKAAAKGKPSQFVLPEWISREVWRDFEEMRRKLRAPLTDRARQFIVADLVKLEGQGQHAEDVLNQSITNGWRGVFPLKNSQEVSHGNHPSPAKQRTDANRRALAEAAIKRGWFTPDDAAGSRATPMAESGCDGIDGRIPDGFRTAKPEILAPERRAGDRGIAHQAGTGVLSTA
jgi:hypothetical protein